MSKLSTILSELERNPNLIVAHRDEYPPAVTETGYSNHHEGYNIDICVAPKKELYLPVPLNFFMDGLVSLIPDHKREFSLTRDPELYTGGWGKKFKCIQYVHRLNLGYLSFQEKIGQKRISGETVRLIVSREAEASDLQQMINEILPLEISGIDSDIYRRIWIHVYPNQKIAEKKYGKNDLGRQMTIFHLEDYVPDIKVVYNSFEEYLSGA